VSGSNVTAADIGFGSTSKPERFERLGEGHYRLTTRDEINSELMVKHVRRERHQLYAELTAYSGLPNVRTVGGVLFTATANLSSLRERDTIARALQDRVRGTEVAEWRGLLDELAIHVSEAERTGDPGVLLKDVPITGRTSERLIRPRGFTLPEHLPAMLFGDGDVFKTYTADAIAVDLARRGMPTAIVDAEMTVDTHLDRVQLLTEGRIPDGLLYIGATRPLIHERDRLAEDFRKHGIRYAIFDSVAFLCHEKPETADAAMSYFRAVRSLGRIGSLHLAHTTKGEDGDQKPFGSAFWFNSVRALWYAKRADTAAQATSTDIGYYVRKFNLGRRPEDHALRFTFTDSSTMVEPVEIATHVTLARGMTVRDRLVSILRGGARDVNYLAAEMPDVDPDTLRRKLRQYGDNAKRPVFSKLPHGRYGLAEWRTG
jgi:hypothetical protein